MIWRVLGIQVEMEHKISRWNKKIYFSKTTPIPTLVFIFWVSEGVGSDTLRRVGRCRIRYLPTGCRRRSSDTLERVFQFLGVGGCRIRYLPTPPSEGVGSATFRRGVGVGVPTPQGRFLGVGGCRIRYLPTGCFQIYGVGGCRIRYLPTGCRRRSSDAPG